MNKKSELKFEDFKKLANNPKLSQYEKIGFPNSYREGKNRAIVEDINSKLPMSSTKNKIVVDIGCGCSELVQELIRVCKKNHHKLILIDSEEMLKLVPNSKNVIKLSGYFPEIPGLFEKYLNKVDYILSYSVLHYVFTESSIFDFIHKAIGLLKNGGSFLIGDIPNISKRRRFLQSAEGRNFQNNYSRLNKRDLNKGWTFYDDDSQKIDDATIFLILSRFRSFNCETYLMPQKDNLPMANRREDILIVKR